MNMKTIRLFALTLSFCFCAQAASEPTNVPSISIDRVTGSGVLEWLGLEGRTYFILSSEDLETWEYAPVIEIGQSLVIGWGFASTDATRFFRLKYTERYLFDAWSEDLDGDSVSNIDELQQESDPFSAEDADGNGLADDWELFHSLTAASGDEETPPDGLTNQKESLIGSNPTAGFDSSSQMTIYTPN